MRTWKVVLTVLILSVATASLACQFDLDCSIGSKCLKQTGKLEGVCVTGTNPGNDNDKKPYRDPLDISKKVGDTCSFDLDCGIGNYCAKESGSLKGVCLKR
jgi:hypothetical protein